MRYIGLDVHKDNITVCVLSDAGKVVFKKDFKKTDGTCDCLAKLFDHVGKSGFCVLMETEILGICRYVNPNFLTLRA